MTMELLDLSDNSLAANAAAFGGAAAVIAYVGTRLASVADRLADRTGLGEAITGTIFLGLTTSLPGLTASITAALEGHAALAIANAVGGIAVQTAFIAAGDIAYRKANLEHAAASLPNMIQAALLVLCLALTMLGLSGPDAAVAHMHPITPILILAAGGGYWMLYRSRQEPMWRPRVTAETVEDVPDEASTREPLATLLLEFSVSAVLVVAAGALVAHTAGNLTQQAGISQTIAGGVFSAIATSLPELITTVAAVRRGALTLAVSDIVGGNFFDIIFVVAADIAYLEGSLFHAQGVGAREIFLLALAIVMNMTLLLGLLYRQREGPANIGFESALIVAEYAAGLLVLGLLF